MGYRYSSGQSAIEYLMTYGWMLLVVAVTGGAIFATVGDQSVESTTGFDGNVQVDNFGLSGQGELGLEVRDGSGQGITVSKVNVSDPDTGQWIYKEFTGENRVGVGSSKIFELPNVTQSDSTNELGVEITYDSEGLSNLSGEGTINGQLELNNTGSFEGLPEDDHQSIDVGNTQDLVLSYESVNGISRTGDNLTIDLTEASDQDVIYSSETGFDGIDVGENFQTPLDDNLIEYVGSMDEYRVQCDSSSNELLEGLYTYRGSLNFSVDGSTVTTGLQRIKINSTGATAKDCVTTSSLP